MNQIRQTVHGVAGLQKHDMKVRSIVFMIYCLVAAGAFGIEEMISEAGPGMTLILLIVFPIIWAYPISNMVAEMGSVLPSEGGVYVWVKEAFGEFWGFQAGWWATVSTYITNGVYVALVADYTSSMIPMSDLSIQALKIGMILIFTIVNLLGLREVGQVSTLLAILILSAFALVAVVGLINWQYNPMIPVVPPDYSILEGIGGGICICVWMYCGYECISNMAGEVKNPQVIPKGLLIAMPLIALTYVLPTLGGLASLGIDGVTNWENWATDGGFSEDSIGYATVLTQYLGEAWGYVFLVIAIVSQCAIFNTYLASGSRGFFVLADDNLCPGFLFKISKSRGVPYIAILSLAVITMILAQSDFTTLVMAEVVFMLALYIILPLAVVKLRKTLPAKERKEKGLYVMSGGKIGLALFAGLPIVIAVFALLINGTDYFCLGLVATATGPVAYLIFKWMYGGLAKNDPVKYPLNVKTRLGFGDTLQVGIYACIAGALAFLGHFFLLWYEGDSGAEYYADEGESVFFRNFDAMINGLRWGGLIVLALGILLIVLAGRIEVEKNKKTVS